MEHKVDFVKRAKDGWVCLNGIVDIYDFIKRSICLNVRCVSEYIMWICYEYGISDRSVKNRTRFFEVPVRINRQK